jgi:hypothetical protein
VFWNGKALLIIFVGLTEIVAETQGNKTLPTEQSLFGMEGPAIERPVTLPAGVLKILQKNDFVLTCLEKDRSPNEIPASWFVGSEIHLDGPGQIDLIVVPKNGCLLGANVGPFWIFRKVRMSYVLILDVSSHDLEVLGTRWNGLRDIKIWSATVNTLTSEVFRFDGQRYITHEKKSTPIK